MKLKNLIASSILMFSLSSTTLFYLNKINLNNKNVDNTKIINEKSIDPNINMTVNLSTKFYGFVFKYDIKNNNNLYITKLKIEFAKSIDDINSNNYLYFLSSDINNNVQSIDDTLSIVCGQPISNIDINDWTNSLNKNTVFNNLSIGTNISNINNNLYYFNSDFSYSDGTSHESGWTKSPLSLSNSIVENYDRANLSNIPCSYISDKSDPYYGWFEGEIILNNQYTDIIKSNSVIFYDKNQETKYNSENFKLQFNNNKYNFFLMPYDYGNNDFWIEFNLEYTLNLSTGNKVPFKHISKYKLQNTYNSEKYSKPIVTTNISELNRKDGIQYFRLVYSIILKNENEDIDSIYVAHSTNLEVPFSGLESDKFTSISGQVSFSINATSDEQYFDDLVLVVKTKVSYSNNSKIFKTSSESIAPFSVSALNKNISIDKFDLVSQSRTSATYSYNIDIGDNYKITKVIFQPTEDNIDYTGPNELKPIEFNANPIPLNGTVNITNLPSSSTINVDPKFRIVLTYQTAIDHIEATWDAKIVTIERATNYKTQTIPSDTIDSIDIKNNKAIINWKINEYDLGDDTIDSVVLSGSESIYDQYFSTPNYSDDNLFVYGQFIINGLEYNKNYTYTLTYNIRTWVTDESGPGIVIPSNDELVTFKSGSKDYTKQALIWIIFDLLLIIILVIIVIFISIEISRRKYNIGYNSLKNGKKIKSKSNFI